MSKHWTELTDEAKHEIYRFRLLFFEEHRRADELIVSKEGIPLKAVYYSPECPGYGKTYTEVPIEQPLLKDINT